MKPVRVLAWLGIGALVVLTARTLAYALSPSPLAAMLSHQAGGPRLPIIAVVSVVLGVGVSSCALWLAALGVRERRLLETRPLLVEPRLRIGRLLARSLVLWVTTMLAFALTESYIHWRAGLGWHGIHCLVGPVHRDVIPILGALSLVAAALVATLEHVLAWMRRVLAAITARLPRLGLLPGTEPELLELSLSPLLAGPHGARGPPRLS
jgi:hypothetical protein